jgi:hypothetical protein
MSQDANILLHKALIAKAQSQFAVGSTKRLEIISRSIQGIRRALLESYDSDHFEGFQA